MSHVECRRICNRLYRSLFCQYTYFPAQLLSIYTYFHVQSILMRTKRLKLFCVSKREQRERNCSLQDFKFLSFLCNYLEFFQLFKYSANEIFVRIVLVFIMGNKGSKEKKKGKKKKGCRRRKGKDAEVPPRVVWLNAGDKNKGYPKNKIVTSKYTAWNFIPKNLFEQFRRIANFYFLCICIIVLSVESPVSPVTTVLPLCIVILITMIKQGIEDTKRHKNDREVNNKVVKVVRNKVEVAVKARDIQVGDLVIVHRDEDVPCDLVLLGSSDPDGKAFLTTANLDGETNLKTKTVPHMLRLFPNEHLTKMDARIECEPPNADLYNFYGKIQVFPGDDAGVYGSMMRRAGRGRSALGPPPPVKRSSVAYGEVGEEGRRSLKRIGLVVGEDEKDEKGDKPEGKEGVGKKGPEGGADDPQAQGVRLSRDAEDGGFPLRRFSVGISAPLDQENLLLRCTTLRNTDRVYGCAVYTGQETRMSLNSLLTHHKFSVIERRVNWFLLFFLGVLCVEIIISMVLKYEDERKTGEGKRTYMKDYYNTKPMRIFIDILIFLVIYNYVIPISLYVTMELQKFFGAMWFSHDLDIWDEEMQERAMYNTTDINEDMGQIEVLLTDKTGTLTQNEMKFKRCMIGDSTYAEEDGKMLELAGDGDVAHGKPVSELTPEMEEFFIALALCNTVQLETAEQLAKRPELSKPLSKKEQKALEKKEEQKRKKEEEKDKKDGDKERKEEDRRSSASKKEEGKRSSASTREKGGGKEPEEEVEEEEEEEEETEEEMRKRLEKQLEGVPEKRKKEELKRLEWEEKQKKKEREKEKKKKEKEKEEEKQQEMKEKEEEEEEEDEEKGKKETKEERRKRLEKQLEGVPEKRKKEELKKLEWEEKQREKEKEKEEKKKRKKESVTEEEKGGEKETGAEGQGDQPKRPEGPLGPEGPFYAATSPDEKSLVEAAARQGVILKEIKGDEIILEVKGKPRKYRKVDVLEFTSERKRMSVIVEDEQGRILLLCKGADTSVVPLSQSGGGGKKGRGSKGRLRAGGEASSSDIDNAVNDFSKRGLRVMVVGSREMSREEWMARGQEVEEARQTVSSDRKRLMERAYEHLENGVEVLGATAVEDALQDDVQGTLESLRAAGIRIWVLTGDNMDTAINISYACGHFKEGTEHLQLVQADSVEGCSMAMMRLLDHVMDDRYRQYGLVVDGQSLTYAMERPGLFRDVAFCCYAVICCRMSPLQKSEVVTVVKKAPNKPITAAIGDGANDVSMILESHVGFGLMGREGRQAVRSADFAFARFRYLQKALLVHGHWYYERLATLVLYFFYKNVVFIFPQFYYGFYSAFSTQPLYDFIFLMLYNVLFTSAPILVYGLFEQAAPARDLYDFPRYYHSITQNALMRWSVFFRWLAFGVWHSLVVFFVPVLTIEYFNATLYINSQPMDDTGLGTLIYHNVVWVVNLKLLLHSRYWTWIFALFIGLSVFGFMLIAIIYSLIKANGHAMYYVYIHLLESPMFWLISILTIVLCLIPDIAYLVISKYVPQKTKQKTPKPSCYCWDDDPLKPGCMICHDMLISASGEQKEDYPDRVL